MSVSVSLAAAVVERINSGSYSMPVDAVRGWAPRYQRKELNTLRVFVVPSLVTPGDGTRHHARHDYQIAIGIWKAIEDPSSTEEADALSAVTQEIADRLLFWNPEVCGSYLSLEYSAAPDPDYLADNVWVSAIVVTYSTLRPLT